MTYPKDSELPSTSCPSCGQTFGNVGARGAHMAPCIDGDWDEYDLALSISIEECIQQAEAITETAIDMFDDPALLWTGGKDSTTLLHLVRETVGLDAVTIYLIDHYQHFPETLEYVDEHANRWDFDYETTQYEPAAGRIPEEPPYTGDSTDEWVRGEPLTWISIDDLDKQGQTTVQDMIDDPESPVPEHEIRDNTGGREVPLLVGTILGDTLLKTLPLRAIANQHDVVLSGIRKWETTEGQRNEKGSRFRERYFSSRSNPRHYRCHPILDMREAMTYAFLQHPERNTSMNPLYEEGYRSIGAVPETEKPEGSDEERGGRSPEKEAAMAALRRAGYM